MFNQLLICSMGLSIFMFACSDSRSATDNGNHRATAGAAGSNGQGGADETISNDSADQQPSGMTSEMTPEMPPSGTSGGVPPAVPNDGMEGDVGGGLIDTSELVEWCGRECDKDVDCNAENALFEDPDECVVTVCAFFINAEDSSGVRTCIDRLLAYYQCLVGTTCDDYNAYWEGAGSTCDTSEQAAHAACEAYGESPIAELGGE